MMKIKLKSVRKNSVNDHSTIIENGLIVDVTEEDTKEEDEIKLESITINGIINNSKSIKKSKTLLRFSRSREKGQKQKIKTKLRKTPTQSILKQFEAADDRLQNTILPKKNPNNSVIRIKSKKQVVVKQPKAAAVDIPIQMSTKSKPKSKLKTLAIQQQSIPIDHRFQRNPFELVSCQQFDLDEQPFQVKIKCQVLAIMDLHAHSLKTEIIGCLGGHYCRVTKTVHILVVEPCCSIDNHSMQCEIDPVSLINATEKLAAQNYELVGWYHSHPNFLPEPSLRDIETQNYYQKQFAKDCGVEGGRPFVGLIVTPYLKPDEKIIRNSGLNSKSFEKEIPVKPLNSKMFYANDKIYNCFDYTFYRYFKPELNKVLSSSYKCFWIFDDAMMLTSQQCTSSKSNSSKLKNCQIPYEIKVQINRDENLIPSISNKLSEMCEFILRDYPESIINHRARYVNIGSISVTYLEKIIASLSHHLQSNPFLCSDHESDILRLQCVAILVKDLLK